MKVIQGIRVLTLLLPLLAIGCGKELTAGGAREGEVITTVTSDPAESDSRTPTGDPSFSMSGTSGGVAEGDLTVAAFVSLVANGREMPLNEVPASASFRIEVADSALLAGGMVEARAYTHVRLRFTRVEAQLSGNLPLAGLVRVDLGTGPQVIDIPLLVEVHPAGLTRLVVDLNAHRWLGLADPVTRLVPTAAFLAAVEVREH